MIQMKLSQLKASDRKPPDRIGPHSSPGEDMDSTIVSRRRDVAFNVEGVTCRAWVYEPKPDAPRPAACIVMAHGLGGTRDASLQPYAERFAAAGFGVVLFDYRYLGASDGEPRQLISPKRHLKDWQAATDFARGLPGVDPARIGLWGTSLSGGHVVMAAARDSSVAAIAAQCPMLDGMASARLAMQRGSLRGVMVRLRAALKDVARAAIGLSPVYVPLVARSGELGVMASDKAYAGILSIVPPGWCNQIAARILFTLPIYRPVRHAHKVKCPTLLVACSEDTIVSAKSAVETAERIGKKARLVSLPIDHFDIYKGEWFERGCGEQVAFFRQALQKG
jgi:fermentation-respiration switch protein FrsA (DUF1100 family)